ncbi:MAG: NADH-quinone oxidoreductase subunit J [Planctomycetes bacterium]|nr:NADH-quinone oxidoreductase subunit J [Planctomycetota bacterium]
MILHDLLALVAALLLLYLGTRLVRAARDDGPGAALDLFKNAMRQGLWLAIIPALAELYHYLGLQTRQGLEDGALRLLMISVFVMLPVVLIKRTASWVAFEVILAAPVAVGLLREALSSDAFGIVLSDSRYLALVVFAIIAASTLVIRGAITGWGRTGLGVLAGLAVAGAAVSLFIVTDFEVVCFWLTAFIAIGAGVALLVSDRIVHMAFWLLASLAAFASFYLLLGADFLGFTQVLVYIGGILILFLFGVMLTQRVDVPLKAAISWRVLIPGVIIGVLTTGLLVFLAGGNSWSQKPIESITRLSPNAGELAAKPTAFALGESFMSTYILPFEVVSVLLLVAMIGATYIARGKSEGDSAGAPDGEGGAA